MLPTLASVLSAITIALPFHHPELFFLTWCGLVPWLWAIHTGTAARAYLLGLLFGLCLFATTTYWVQVFLNTLNPNTWIMDWLLAGAYWIYAAHIPALLALCTRWLMLNTTLSHCVSFALIGTLLFFAIPVLFPADFATSQTRFLIALQPISITGALGLHCLILLCNSLLYQWLKPDGNRNLYIEIAGCLVITIWFGYGYLKLRTPSETDAQLSVGLVQPNHPASLKIPEPERGYSRAFSPELELSQLLAAQGAQLIIWPELRYTGFFNNPEVKASIYQFLANKPVHLWIQDLKVEDTEVYNISLLLSGNKIQGEYYKQERIPFGEKLPFNNVPFLNELAMRFFKDFYTPIATDKQRGTFLVNGITAQTFICYESTKPFYINRYLKNHTQRPAFLLFQSNNSWFGNSIQPELHRSTGILRSIEQGLPSLHAVNNGPSTVTSKNGESFFSSSRNIRRGYLVDLSFQHNPSPTFFSRYPFGFISLIALLTLAYGVLLVVKNIIRPR